MNSDLSPKGQIKWRPSPNFGQRAKDISFIIIHATEMPTATGALERLCDPNIGVSAHYLIDEGGQVTQLVRDEDRAFHAGWSRWEGVGPSLNETSIGIELAHPAPGEGPDGFEPTQIEALLVLLGSLVRRHGVHSHHILAHADIAPARKRDPGEFFPWARLSAAGFGLWPKGDYRTHRGMPVEENRMAEALFAYGYRWGEQWGPCEEDITTLPHVITAAQRHFRPAQVDGLADVELLLVFEDLLRQRGAGRPSSVDT